MQKVFNIQYMEEDIQNFSTTVMFCGTPCSTTNQEKKMLTESSLFDISNKLFLSLSL